MWRSCPARDERAAHEALRAARRCRTWTDEDGAVRLDARLAPDAGAAVVASLRAQSNRCFERARKAGAHEPAEAYAADALVALVTGRGLLGPGGTADPVTGDPATGDPATGGPRATITTTLSTALVPACPMRLATSSPKR